MGSNPIGSEEAMMGVASGRVQLRDGLCKSTQHLRWYAVSIAFRVSVPLGVSVQNGSEVITGSWRPFGGRRHSGRAPVSLWGELGDSVFYL